MLTWQVIVAISNPWAVVLGTALQARYEVIDNFVPTQGERGLEVMYSTCTAQVHLDLNITCEVYSLDLT